MIQWPSVSIVVNTYNRADSLADTLSGLRFLDYPTYEVIVVNGPSTDGTEALLERWRDRIKIGACAEANLSVSRNAGIALATGDIVAFIDDDAVPHPQWLKELVRLYDNPSVGGAGGFTIDNTGVRYQVGKTLCDRFGNAYNMSPFFDERPLNAPGVSHYPSLLGTNSSFRRSALVEIGGFDHAFAYLLDETDVCLRLVDAGYEIHYVPKALVYHRFAASHLRTIRRIPRSLRPSCVSKAYFIMRHGARRDLEEAGRQLEAYRRELNASNRWHFEHGNISRDHYSRLTEEVASGTQEGHRRGVAAMERSHGDLEAIEARDFVNFNRDGEKLTIVFVSQGFPPQNQAGIARWTWMMATGLSRRGHQVHVIARADGLPSTEFRDGFWLHRIRPESGTATAGWLDLPPNIAEWSEAARRKLASLMSFGVDVVSFPIWDLEGMAIAQEGNVPVVMSLHTTYALAKPFKPEWLVRRIYSHRMVDRMIRQEKAALEKLPVILANSRAIIADIKQDYEVALGDRVVLALHGTTDPFEEKPDRRQMRLEKKGSFTAAFVGRFEPRKGFDIAAAALLQLLESDPEAEIIIAGDTLGPVGLHILSEAGALALIDHPRAHWRGMLERETLDDLYCTVDAVVMPSRYESFGLVTIEAMAGGAVVIALAAAAPAEILVDGATGYLVASDVQAGTQICDRLLELSKDRDLRQRLSTAARAEFERSYTIDHMVESAEVAYRRAAGQGGAGDGI